MSAWANPDCGRARTWSSIMTAITCWVARVAWSAGRRIPSVVAATRAGLGLGLGLGLADGVGLGEGIAEAVGPDDPRPAARVGEGLGLVALGPPTVFPAMTPRPARATMAAPATAILPSARGGPEEAPASGRAWRRPNQGGMAPDGTCRSGGSLSAEAEAGGTALLG